MLATNKTEKALLGRFMTTNSARVLQGMQVPTGVHVIEPFMGNGDLPKHFALDAVECYDIRPCAPCVQQRDVFNEPPSFQGKFVLTNPPYLAKNKSPFKTVYEKYGEDDLYKCFVRMLINDPCIGGILVVPINFLSGLQVFKDFMFVYKVERMNVFEEQVFDDTSCAVCSFQFSLSSMRYPIPITFFPEETSIMFLPSEANNYMIGGEIYNLPASKKFKVKNGSSRLFFRCLDNSAPSKIGAEILDEPYVGKVADRVFLSVVIEPSIGGEREAVLAQKFNDFLDKQRVKYKSMFLTNYREGNRKRITFALVYSIIGHLLDNMV